MQYHDIRERLRVLSAVDHGRPFIGRPGCAKIGQPNELRLELLDGFSAAAFGV
jgi:hypothetical protein